MGTFKKHEDTLDIQIRTKFLDVYGNEMPGVIEYDPATGIGKRLKIDAPPSSGLTESFFHAGGSIELDGRNFDDTNQDDDVIQAIKDVVKSKISRSTDPTVYDEMIRQHIDQNRKNKNPPKDKNQQAFDNAKGNNPNKPPTQAPVFQATENIKKNAKVVIDWDTGNVSTDPANKPQNVFSADEERRKQDATDKPRPHGSSLL